MSDDELYGECTPFDCALTEGDAVDVQRIGYVGSDLSMVGVTVWIQEPELEEVAAGVHVFRAPVMLPPASARMMAAALIDAADEADGLETALLTAQMGELSE